MGWGHNNDQGLCSEGGEYAAARSWDGSSTDEDRVTFVAQGETCLVAAEVQPKTHQIGL